MRLLKFGSHGELSLTKDLIEDIPRYAILSHTWGADDDEVTLNDLKDASLQSKAGYKKIQFCGEQARKDGLQYVWVDTCCIDKANHTELAEALVSMYRWYSIAEKCYVYLSDLSVEATNNNNGTERSWESDFRKSRWFTRGWTLQELLAPRSVEFFSREGEWLGDKSTLEQKIHEITQIPIMALRGVPLPNFSVEERLRWAAKRTTKRKEDKAYCLLGIFNVFMSPIYGEGENAFIRLQNEIDRLSASKVEVDPIPDSRRIEASFRGHIEFERGARLTSENSDDIAVTNTYEERQKRLLASFNYTGMNERQNGISAAHEHTYHWVFDHRSSNGANDHRTCADCDARRSAWSSLVGWLESDGVFYWISGKPGSGKSTLMKHISYHSETARILQIWRPQSLILRHFFWKPGSSMQRSLKGLLCSLLHQILCTHKQAATYILQNHPITESKVSDTDWSSEELERLFVSVVENSLPPACVFIDGLDEMPGKADSIALLALFQRLRPCSNIKFCAASRPEPFYQRRFGQGHCLKLQELTTCDMRDYATSELRFLQDQFSPNDRKDLIHDLLRKSEGVFLWLQLAIHRLKFDEGIDYSIEELRQRVQELPQALSDMYSDMWSRLDDGKASNRKLAAEYLNVAILYQDFLSIFRKLPLPRSTERYDDSLSVLNLVAATDDDLQKMLWTKDENTQKCKEVALGKLPMCVRDIKVCCAGLLEVLEDDINQDSLGPSYGVSCGVKFTHRTAYDFLVEHEEGIRIRQAASRSMLSHWIRFLRGRLVSSRFFDKQACGVEGILAPLAAYLEEIRADDSQFLLSAEVIGFLEECLRFCRLGYFEDRFPRVFGQPEVGFYCKAAYAPFIDFIYASISRTSEPKSLATNLLRLLGSWDCSTDRVRNDLLYGPETSLIRALMRLGADPSAKGPSDMHIGRWKEKGRSFCQFSSACTESLVLVLRFWNGCLGAVPMKTHYNVARVESLISSCFAIGTDYTDVVPLYFHAWPDGLQWVDRRKRLFYDDGSEADADADAPGANLQDPPDDPIEEYAPHLGLFAFLKWQDGPQQDGAGSETYTLSAGRYEYLYYRRLWSHGNGFVVAANLAFVIQMIAKIIAIETGQPSDAVGHIMERLAPGSTATAPHAVAKYVEALATYRVDCEESSRKLVELIKSLDSRRYCQGRMDEAMSNPKNRRLLGHERLEVHLAREKLGYIFCDEYTRQLRLKVSPTGRDNP